MSTWRTSHLTSVVVIRALFLTLVVRMLVKGVARLFARPVKTLVEFFAGLCNVPFRFVQGPTGVVPELFGALACLFFRALVFAS